MQHMPNNISTITAPNGDAAKSEPKPTSCPSMTRTPTPNISYRIATTADAPAISSLVGRVWAQFFAYSVTADDLKEHLATNLAPATIAGEIEDGDIVFLVAEVEVESEPCASSEVMEDSHTTITPLQPPSTTAPAWPTPSPIVGVAQLVRTPTSTSSLTVPTSVELRKLYVSETLHGSGVAASLVERTEALAVTRWGAQSLWLGVWEDNPRAQRFYTRCGFKTVGEKKFVVGESVRRNWVMEREVGGK